MGPIKACFLNCQGMMWHMQSADCLYLMTIRILEKTVKQLRLAKDGSDGPLCILTSSSLKRRPLLTPVTA